MLLELESWDDNPQLKGERLVLDLEDYELDVYYDDRPIDSIPRK
jgi:hypothetical protein